MASSSSSTLTSSSFSSFHDAIQKQALKATKNSAGLPSDISFYKSIDPSVASQVDVLEKRVLGLVGTLLGLVQGKGKGKARENAVAGEDIVDDFHGTIVDSMDVLLERTDICLDEYSGKLKRPTVPVTQKSKLNPILPQKGQSEPKPYLPASLQHASQIVKPQSHFHERTEQKHKYNAKVPLGYVLQKDDLVDRYLGDEDDEMSSHPYYYETTHLEYPKHVYETPSSSEAPPPSSCTYVSTSEGFTALLNHLQSVHELAVDLEHHSYRTYAGFLCLMQITTRTGGDFIVDLLIPDIRSRMHELNAIFTDPSKVKVFHGAESDIVWLQQDFGVYVVGLFDTFHASKLLELPRHSLSTLLSLYADFTPDKKYQQADWRIRPLPQEMLEYAQSDTHFLLYIYDCVRSALLDKGKSRSVSPDGEDKNPLSLLNETLHRSSVTSLRVYRQEPYDAARGSGPGGWDTLARKWNKGALVHLPEDNVQDSPVYGLQRAVYRAVHYWRDRVSREEDESTRYVLPNHFIFTLAETQPVDMAALLNVFRGNVPQVVKKRARELLECIKGAVKSSLGARLKKAEKEVEVEKEKIEAATKVEEASMQVDDIPIKDANSKLWGLSQPSSISAPTSLLFSSAPKAVSTPISRPTSDLFGKLLSAKQPASTITSSSSSFPGSSSSAKSSPTFQALVARINSTLVIAPSAPKILADMLANSKTTSLAAPVEPKDEPEADPALGMQTDQPMAFVPASERTTIQTTHQRMSVDGKMEDMGPIVVVGRRGAAGTGNKKKRKRTTATAAKSEETGASEDIVDADAGGRWDDAETEETRNDGPEASGSTTPNPPKAKKRKSELTALSPTPEEGGEAFDFASAPNVLDVSGRRERGSGGKDKKKQQQKKSKGASTNFFGDFPAPPKERSTVKSGNVSATFRPGK